MGIEEERVATEKWTTFKLDEVKYDDKLFQIFGKDRGYTVMINGHELDLVKSVNISFRPNELPIVTIQAWITGDMALEATTVDKKGE